MFFSSKISRTGCGFTLACARDALTSAEALLTTILSIKDKELLATAPDPVFSMISFAAAYLTTSRLLVLHSKASRQIPGASAELLARTIKCLRHISLSTDDNASRCAYVISGFVDMWDERLAAYDAEATSKNPDEPNVSQVSSSISPMSKPTPQEYAKSESSTTVGLSPETTSSPSGFDSMFNLDQDILFGPEFWQYFSDIQPDINATCA